jgi:maltoporin
MPPAVQVVRNRARADRAEAVELGDGVDFDGYRHRGEGQRAKGKEENETAGAKGRGLRAKRKTKQQGRRAEG